jgi:lipoprotein-releasing system permease protein
MYTTLLCLRYLRTRYIALASIISVMLGVATLIVVNSVMSGFQHEMITRLHGILSDIVVEAHSLEGIQYPAETMATIRETLGDDLVALTANIHVPAILSFEYQGQWITKQVNLIGVDADSVASVSDFGEFLLHPANRSQLSFELRESGYDARLGHAGWSFRRESAEHQRALESIRAKATTDSGPQTAAPDAAPTGSDPFLAQQQQQQSVDDQPIFDPAHDQFSGIVLGLAISNVRQRDSAGKVVDFFLCRPGEDVKVTFPSAGTPPKAVNASFTIIDFYESKMSEYDATFAFVPLDELQRLRGMIDPASGVGAVSAIQIRLRPGADLNGARDRLQARFPPYAFPYHVQTWKDLQGPLLSAVQMETTLLNILLFLIIAVAGFGILATFFMIVVEKTRDIGILKALGASSRGVMTIFLGYGLALGIVGGAVGLWLGLLFVWNINDLARLVEFCTGREVFDPTVYYFQQIPTIVEPGMILAVLFGAVTIAVLASILPAIRASRLHPVRALRYE